MTRLILLALFASLAPVALAQADDDWEWEDITEIKMPRHDHENGDEHGTPQDEEFVPVETEDGDAVNYGAYFGSGEEFLQTNVDYEKELFITITDVPVDARSGGRLDDLVYEDDGLPAEQLASEEGAPAETAGPENVFGPLYGVPDDAVGLEDYDPALYGDMEPGDEDIVEGSSDSDEASAEEAAAADEAEVEEAAADESVEDAPAEEEAVEQGEEQSKEQRNNRRERRKPEEWWNE